uniref:Uncharacterized protein n=1 Tax=Kalanchoe fedtschenkoi TaxID=63787 RepID=A0A7N0VG52_KALFE
MASSRIARYATEVAPAQMVSVMRQRANKMLDTIQEEEIHASGTSISTSNNSNGSIVPGSPSVDSFRQRRES